MAGRVRRPGRRADPTLAARRREQILDAAATLFARHGYQDLDVQTLADRLGFAKGTLYRYFPSKERLFLAAVDRGMERMRAFVRSAYEPAADPLDRLALAVRAYLEFYRDHPDLVELMVIERAEFRDRKAPTYLENRQAVAAEWREVYADLIRAGRVRPVKPDQLIDMIGDLMYGTMFTNHFAATRPPLTIQARQLTEFIFSGILTSAELARRQS